MTSNNQIDPEVDKHHHNLAFEREDGEKIRIEDLDENLDNVPSHYEDKQKTGTKSSQEDSEGILLLNPFRCLE